jgi:hypothetical protein
MTDWGAHHLDIVQWAVGCEHSGPHLVRATGEFPADNFFETPADFDVEYVYRGGVNVKVTGRGKNGITFRGSDGWVFVSRSEIQAEPKEILDHKLGTMPIKLYRSDDHHDDWVRSIRQRTPPISDVEIGHRSATVCHLGNIAIRLGCVLSWQPELERFHEALANRRLHKPMRGPWSL